MIDITGNIKPASFYIRKGIGIFLLVVLAAIFILSGISKLIPFHGQDPVKALEWSFLDLGVTSFMLSGILARVMIGLEFMVAGFLLFHIQLRRFTYPLVLVLLAAFNIYLFLLIRKYGNTGNCGCFGDWEYIRPLDSIYKNLIMMGVTVLLYWLHPAGKKKGDNTASFTLGKNTPMIATFVGMAAFVLPFVFNPLDAGSEPKVTQQAIDLDPLYTSSVVKPPMELREGKHIVAFMSLTCPHCRKAAYLMHVIHQQHPELEFFLVLAGHPDMKQEFFDNSRAADLKWMLFSGQDFEKMAGPSVPAIYYINNGVIERKANYNQLDPDYIKDWLSHK